MSFAGVTFLAPLVLLGLLTLPIVWWILRISPPTPRDQIFPPLRILEAFAQKRKPPLARRSGCSYFVSSWSLLWPLA